MIDLGKFIVHYYSTFITIYNSTFNQLHDGKSIVLRPREKDPVLGLWLATVTLLVSKSILSNEIPSSLAACAVIAPSKMPPCEGIKSF